METIVTRRKNYFEDKFWMTSSSFERGGKHYNCLYVHFCKEHFPAIVYPQLVQEPYGKLRIFKYWEGSLANLNWHWGITFYEENLIVASGKTVVKAGCDFTHLYDDYFMEADRGEEILRTHGSEIAEQFKTRFGRKDG